MSDGRNRQLNLPPTFLANETQAESVRPKCTQGDQAHELAAELFDEALTEARLSTAEVAYLFGVSESLVRRMRSKDARERVSLTQLLKLPARFHLELHRAMNRRFGFGRQLLRRLLDDLSDLALVLER
jgi:hypothetical protein